ncbi:MAG: hypothetical protein JWN46_586 [Acidimicrobiales bacterium]|nr:hypothetical protein [Acidimicrobiales bacterium]
MTPCRHLEEIRPVIPSSDGCFDCLRDGRRDWVHLRVCQSCGLVGCCDSSPAHHARRHAAVARHAIVRSYEPGEQWFWCYVEDMAFELPGLAAGPSHFVPPPAPPPRSVWTLFAGGVSSTGVPGGSAGWGGQRPGRP